MFGNKQHNLFLMANFFFKMKSTGLLVVVFFLALHTSKNLYMDLYMAELFHMFLTTTLCKLRTVFNDVFTNIG